MSRSNRPCGFSSAKACGLDHSVARVGDLEKLEQIAAGYPTRERFLTELTLDPPEATAAEAGAPVLDEDHLILSTIHSAKGQEWARSSF